jgi:hypothetical protein
MKIYMNVFMNEIRMEDEPLQELEVNPLVSN